MCGITTAPSTLMMMGIDPAGNAGVTHPAAACGQPMLTMAISNKNESPISDTKPMIIFSIFLYELVNCKNSATTSTSSAPSLMGR